MSELLAKLARADAEFQYVINERCVTDAALESAAGTGSLADGRSTPGDGSGYPGVNCTCCCN